MADEKTTDQLKRIIQLLQDSKGNPILREIFDQNAASLANQATIIDQNAQIIKLLIPAPDDDVAGFIVTNSQPVKQS